MHNYEAKKAARISRYRGRASAATQEANQRYAQAKKMADIIPFGQPILVGHHSEGKDRRYRGRISQNFQASFEAQKKAAYWQERATAAAQNTAISSDDPCAVEKLKAKLATQEDFQTRLKQINASCRKAKLTKSDLQLDRKLETLGLSIDERKYLFSWGECKADGTIAFPSFLLTNNNATIRSIKERIKSLEAKAKDQSSEWMIGGVTISDNVEDNRLQLYFPNKPAQAVRNALKSNGFRWSPSNGCWQRQRSSAARYWAEKICCKHPDAHADA
jgi:hypothetical protein